MRAEVYRRIVRANNALVQNPERWAQKGALKNLARDALL